MEFMNKLKTFKEFDEIFEYCSKKIEKFVGQIDNTNLKTQLSFCYFVRMVYDYVTAIDEKTWQKCQSGWKAKKPPFSADALNHQAQSLNQSKNLKQGG